MTIVRRPSPFSELVTLRQAMDRLLDDIVFPLATFEHGVLSSTPTDPVTGPAEAGA